jgi:hypothetical protein
MFDRGYTMDISKLSIPETATVHISFPGIGKLYSDDDKSKPVTIEVLSPASNEAVKLRKQTVSRILKKKNQDLTADDIEERTIENLIAMTHKVNNLEYNGEKINKATIGKVYADPNMGWLTDQVAVKIGGWDNFLL